MHFLASIFESLYKAFVGQIVIQSLQDPQLSIDNSEIEDLKNKVTQLETKLDKLIKILTDKKNFFFKGL